MMRDPIYPHAGPDQGAGSGGGLEPQDAPAQSRRAGSVSLRGEGPASAADDANLLDPANKSLADAIRITFRILQFAMLGLAVAYLFSGFQNVHEGQQGIRLLFGRVETAQIDPGFRFSYPFPFGELRKIEKGVNTIHIDNAFWVEVPPGTPREQSLEKLPTPYQIKPAENSGTLITADGALVHCRVTASYRRDATTQYARNVLPEHEERLVRAAVQRGVVLATARATIDQFLLGDSGALNRSALGLAQEELDRLESGIRIDALAVEDRIAPPALRASFANWLTAQAKSEQMVAEAGSQARKTLSDAAGAAAESLGKAIDRYEAAADDAARSAAMEEINTILAPPSLAGGPSAGRGIGGRVADVLADATLYRSQVVSRRRAEYAYFAAKADQFKSSPLVMVHREWADTMRGFLGRDTVQTILLPPGVTTLQMTLNADPQILKDIDKRIKEKEGADAARKREQEMNNQRFETKTGLTTVPS